METGAQWLAVGILHSVRRCWAAVLVDAAGAVVMEASGAVGGQQTAPRAKLTAALCGRGFGRAGAHSHGLRLRSGWRRGDAGAEAELYLQGGDLDPWVRLLAVLPWVRCAGTRHRRSRLKR